MVLHFAILAVENSRAVLATSRFRYWTYEDLYDAKKYPRRNRKSRQNNVTVISTSKLSLNDSKVKGVFWRHFVLLGMESESLEG